MVRSNFLKDCMHIISWDTWIKTYQCLISENADFLTDQMNAFHVASIHGLEFVFEDINESSIELGIDAQDSNGRTPLWYAVLQNHSRIATKLIQSGYADPNQNDSDGCSPLLLAVTKERCGFTEKLLNESHSGIEVTDEILEAAKRSIQEDPNFVELLLSWRKKYDTKTVQAYSTAQASARKLSTTLPRETAANQPHHKQSGNIQLQDSLMILDPDSRLSPQETEEKGEARREQEKLIRVKAQPKKGQESVKRTSRSDSDGEVPVKPATANMQPVGPSDRPGRPRLPFSAGRVSPKRSGRKKLQDAQYATTLPTSATPTTSSFSKNRSDRVLSDAAQIASDREFAERLSASLNNVGMNDEPIQHNITEEELQARIERERAEGHARLRREQKEDELWADYLKTREQHQGKARRAKQEETSAEWEAKLEERRHSLQNKRVEDVLDDNSAEDDWDDQIEKARHNLAELKRTEETANSDRQSTRNRRDPFKVASAVPRRSKTTGGHGETSYSHHSNVRYESVSSNSSSAAMATGGSPSSGSRGMYDAESERRRLYAFEMGQMERERKVPDATDAVFASQIVDTEADIQRAEARRAARRERERGERSTQDQCDAYTYDRLTAGAPRASDFYNPRLGMGGIINEPAMENGRRFMNEARGSRHTRRPVSLDRSWCRPRTIYNQESGSLVLGALLTDPNDPYSTISAESGLVDPPPENIRRKVRFYGPGSRKQIQSKYGSGVSEAVRIILKGQSEETEQRIVEVETLTFEPGEANEFLIEALNALGERNHAHAHVLPQDMFMVTGLRIVRVGTADELEKEEAIAGYQWTRLMPSGVVHTDLRLQNCQPRPDDDIFSSR